MSRLGGLTTGWGWSTEQLTFIFIHLVWAAQTHFGAPPSLKSVLAACRIYPFLTMIGHQEGTHDGRSSHMDQSLEDRIRERAYEIWTAHGRVHGQADQHWLAAEREILAAATVPDSGMKRLSRSGLKRIKTYARAS
jgi:hypothetical protein